MPLIAWGKRRVAKATHNRAMAADAVQSATCAYLAALTITGLGINALFHIAAALAAVPFSSSKGAVQCAVKAAAATKHDRDRDGHVCDDHVDDGRAHSSCVACRDPRYVQNE
jgi:hypothetical protein